MARIHHFFDKLEQMGGSDLHLSVALPPVIRQRGVTRQHVMEQLLVHRRALCDRHVRPFDDETVLGRGRRARC